MTGQVQDRKRQAPWVVPVRLEDVPESGRHIELHADEATRAALVGFTGLRAVERADASFDVRRQGRDGLRVIGEVRARIGQTCVVTLEPMESEIVEPVDVVFKPAIDGVVPEETRPCPSRRTPRPPRRAETSSVASASP